MLTWNELPSSLKFVLPPSDDYSYVVEGYDVVPSGNNDSPHFTSTVRINLDTEEDAKVWMERMSEHNKCTYRTTKTVKPGQIRTTYKFVKHCQHFAKKLWPKQAENFALSRTRKVKTPLSSQLRNKKTQCPSSFTLAVQIPSKLHQRKAKSQPYLLSHCGVFKIRFNHNHQITAAHTLMFPSRRRRNSLPYLIWVIVPPPQGMLMNKDCYMKQSWISKLPWQIDRLIQALKIFVGFMTNGGLVAMEKTMERACLKNSKKLLTVTTKRQGSATMV